VIVVLENLEISGNLTAVREMSGIIMRIILSWKTKTVYSEVHVWLELSVNNQCL